jgi:hypothetical protein
MHYLVGVFHNELKHGHIVRSTRQQCKKIVQCICQTKSLIRTLIQHHIHISKTNFSLMCFILIKFGRIFQIKYSLNSFFNKI